MTVRKLAMCAVVAAALLGGCSRKGKVPETVTVSGIVTHKGQPVEGATVSFQPKSENSESRPARGTTDASGRFTLKTYIRPGTDVDGAMPGDYLVGVSKMDTQNMTSEDMVKQTAAGKKLSPPRNLLPPRYANVQKSGFKATVSAGEKNEFEFDLKD